MENKLHDAVITRVFSAPGYLTLRDDLQNAIVGKPAPTWASVVLSLNDVLLKQSMDLSTYKKSDEQLRTLVKQKDQRIAELEEQLRAANDAIDSSVTVLAMVRRSQHTTD